MSEDLDRVMGAEKGNEQQTSHLPQVATKPYYKTEFGILYCGDALEVMAGLEANSVDLMVTDPPYFLPAQHYQTRRQFRRNFSDLGILEFFFRIVFEQVQRVLADNGSFYWFCDGQSYPLFYWYSYFFTKNVRPLIWDKKTSINGYGWRHQHELILWGEMPKSKPIKTGDGDIIRCPAVKIDERKHPAEKPKWLIESFIEKSTDEGSVVFDPFLGSGTTAIACEELGRRWIGIELNPDYCEIAKGRIDPIARQGKLF